MSEDRSQREDKESSLKYKITDRRHWVEGDEETGQEELEEMVPSYVKKLQNEAEDKDKRLREYIAAYKAKGAEIEEVKQRLQRENEGRLDQFKAKFFSEILPVVDNLRRASQVSNSNDDLAGLQQGIRMTLDQLDKHLQGCGVETISSVGRTFDPSTDEACIVVATDDPDQDNKIVEELEPGYLFGGKLLKPVKVKVARINQ